MSDRRKTVFILGITSLFMFSPLAMSLFWRPIPLFQNLGFSRELFAPALAWILAMVIAIAYILYTMRVIPLVLSKQKEISLFKLLGDSLSTDRWCCRGSLFSAMAHGYALVERRRSHPSGHHFRRCFWLSPHCLDSFQG